MLCASEREVKDGAGVPRGPDLRHTRAMPIGRGTPYRDPASHTDEPVAPPRYSALARDAVVVVVLFATLASIAHWHEAIDAVSAAMGFPRVR